MAPILISTIRGDVHASVVLVSPVARWSDQIQRVHRGAEDMTEVELKHVIRAVCAGIVDGLRQPFELTSGMSYEDVDLQGLYDRGANVGQAVGAVVVAIRTLGNDGRLAR